MENIVISNSDIEDVIEDVIVTETVYKDDSELRLSNEQMIMEIGNLLPNLPLKRTLLYTDLFQSHLFTYQQKPLLLESFNRGSLLPIIHCVKRKLADTFDPTQGAYLIDLEMDPTNYIKGAYLTDFLSSFVALNKDADEPYPQTSKALYNLHRPFESSSQTMHVATANIDAIWNENNETFRLISPVEIDVGLRPEVIDTEYLKENRCPQGRKYIERSEFITVYEGDAYNTTGYLNNIDSKMDAITFDVLNYQKTLKSLKVNEKVVVCFNIFAFDYQNKPISEVSGLVDENDGTFLHIVLDKNVQIYDVMIKDLYCPIFSYAPFFVYPHDSKVKYKKSMLRYNTIKFPLKKDKPSLLKYIYPQSWSEYCYIYDVKAKYEDMDLGFHPFLKSNNRTGFQQPSKKQPQYQIKTFSDVLNFSKYNQFLQYYPPYYNANTFADSNLMRMLYMKQRHDSGLLYAIQLAETKKSQGEDHLNMKLQEIHAKMNELAFSPIKYALEPRVVKHYTNQKDFKNDNDKGDQLYVDKQYDTTRYHLKALTHLKGKALQQYLLSEIEDEFEVQCIIDGKCPVREGEMAIVKQGSNNLLFRWTKLSNGYMWVKVSNTTCSDKLPSFKEVASNSLLLDTFDGLCKKRDMIKKQRAYKHLSGAAALIENMKEKSYDFEAIKLRLSVICKEFEGKHREFNCAMKGYVDKINYDEYSGQTDNVTLENMFTNFEFNDGPTFMIGAGGVGGGDKMDMPKTILDILCKVIDISLTEEEKAYINTFVEKYHADTRAYTEIKDYETNLYQQTNKLLIDNKKLPKDKFIQLKLRLENAKTDKVQKFTFQTMSKHYFEKILAIVGLMILVIMINYPRVLIKRLIPKCVKFFSYKSHPLLDETKENTRSLIKYMACVLGTLYQPNDMKFGLFSSAEDNAKALQIKIDQILKVNKQLEKAISNKVIDDVDDDIDGQTYDTLNIFFRPCFTFARKQYEDNIIEYLRQINEIIRSKNKTRFYLANIPSIVNACCVEPLTRSTTFYDFFTTLPEFKNIQNKANKETKVEKYNAFIPNSVEHQNFTHKKELLTHNQPIVLKANDSLIVNSTKKGEDWWDAVKIAVHGYWSFLKDILTYDNSFIESNYINVENPDRLTNLKNAYLSFTKGTFSTTLSRFINLYSFPKGKKADKTDPFVILLDKLRSIKDDYKQHMIVYADSLASFVSIIEKNVSRNLESEVSHTITETYHDILWNTYVTLFYLINLVYSCSGEILPFSEPSESDQVIAKCRFIVNTHNNPYLSVIIDIIRYILNTLENYTNINHFKVEDIKEKVEVIRERLKEADMKRYSADDLKRQEERVLKKMGLDIRGSGIDEAEEPEEVVVEIPKAIHAAEEAEFGDFVEYKGENADDDNDHDGYD